jgi:glycerol-3-phosphate dehydrogenase
MKKATVRMNQSTIERARLSSLRENPKAQVLIIGGGINGLATFRDLPFRALTLF